MKCTRPIDYAETCDETLCTETEWQALTAWQQIAAVVGHPAAVVSAMAIEGILVRRRDGS